MYNSRQIHCMQAIGIVPWVRRTAERSPAERSPAEVLQAQDAYVAVEAIDVLTADAVAQGALAPVNAALTPAAQAPKNVTEQLTDQLVVCSGDTESTLLLIFDNRDGASSWPLSKEDDALLDGMLRAIGMSKAAVCSCAMLQDASVQGESGLPSAGLPSTLSMLCHSPRKRFLYFGGRAFAADVIDPVPMTQPTPDGVLDGWSLPSLAVLRNAPQRKRQAWITLKQLRSALDHN